MDGRRFGATKTTRLFVPHRISSVQMVMAAFGACLRILWPQERGEQMKDISWQSNKSSPAQEQVVVWKDAKGIHAGRFDTSYRCFCGPASYFVDLRDCRGWIGVADLIADNTALYGKLDRMITAAQRCLNKFSHIPIHWELSDALNSVGVPARAKGTKMEIRHISKMRNILGLLGAVHAARIGVIDQWIVPNKYSILRFKYGLSIKNHAGTRVDEADIPEIVRECIGVTGYEIEHDGNICRVIIRGEK